MNKTEFTTARGTHVAVWIEESEALLGDRSARTSAWNLCASIGGKELLGVQIAEIAPHGLCVRGSVSKIAAPVPEHAREAVRALHATFLDGLRARAAHAEKLEALSNPAWGWK